MIDPEEKDIGRRVVYTGNHNGPLEFGKIVRFNDHFVFVLYDKHTTPQSTLYEDLEWGPEQ